MASSPQLFPFPAGVDRPATDRDEGVRPASAQPGADVYAAAILGEATRVLSLMDREALSPTAGCGDRTFWSWKFVDFPASRLQESLCVLSFLYSTPLSESPYHRNARLLEWITRGLQFWSEIQHPDGSFDEAYPFERSLAATAFTSFYVGEALEMIKGDLPASTLDATRGTLARAGAWLAANDETHGFLSNHLAAAAGALAHAFRQTGETRFNDRSRYFLDKILRRQSPEGWYDEYGGPDPGYQTHGSFYLARCWEFSGDARLGDSLARASRFLAHFLHPDGSLGGEYASRNTQTYYPAAFEMRAAHDPASAWIARAMRSGVGSGAAAGLHCVDLFNYFPFLNNYVFAFKAAAARPEPAPAVEPSPDPGLVWFPKAGLARVRTARYDAYVGTAKGGVVKVFDRRRRALIYSDCGYVGRLRSEKSVSSQYYDPERPVRVSEASIEVDGDLVEFSRPTMTPVMFVGFRIFTLTVGRFPGLGRWLKALLVKTLIYRRRSIAVKFTRRVEFNELGVRVADRLVGPGGSEITELRRETVFTTIHMGSSRYFIANELADIPAGERIDPETVTGGVALERTVTVN
ncbi:MAG TPA: hypothetical protein VES67_15560 [Vicinamibacterales bacterium]|nr:hypothetical protein [Vicinamibacterales bacterium]